VLATGWGTNSNSIAVPLVAMNAPVGTTSTGSATNPTPGRYGYWVSDEGVKAKITLTDTNMSSRPSTTQGMLVSALLHFTAPSAHNIASIMTNFGITGLTDFRANTNLPKLTSLNGLSFVSNNIPLITNNILAADLTVNGYGVLCDVRKGGLKQDLTSAMESTATNGAPFTALQLRSGAQDGSTNSNDSLMVYRAANLGLPQNMSNAINQGATGPQATGMVLDGLRWQSVYNFYNLYKQYWPQSPVVSSTTGTVPKGIGPPALTSNNTIDPRTPCFKDPASLGPIINYGMMIPSIIADSVVTTLGVVRTNVTVGSNSVTKYYFQVSYYPLVVMHNPYSSALNVGNTAFNITKSLAQNVAIKLTCTTNGSIALSSTNYGPDQQNLWPVMITTNTNGVTTPTNTILQLNPNGTTLYALQLSVTNPPGTIMAPGEIRVYGYPGINKTYTDNSLTNNYSMFLPSSGRILSSTNNFVFGAGFGGVSVTLTNWSGSTNLSDPVSLSYYMTPTPNISYSTLHYGAGGTWAGTATVSTWPSSFSYQDMPGSLPGSGIGSYSGSTLNTTIQSLLANPVSILSVTERYKGTVPGTTYQSFLGQGTNYPIFMGNSIYFCGDRSGNSGSGFCPATETDALITNEPAVSIVPNVVSSNSCTLSWLYQPVGDAQPSTAKDASNNVTLVVRDVPFTPLVSLGQLMHLEEYYNQGLINYSYNLFPVSIPGMSIGGSLCSPEVPPSMNAIFFYNNASLTQSHLWADHSFLANEALFDTYFFSTVPPPRGFSWGSSLTGNNPFSVILSSNSIATNQPLPNGRLIYYHKNGTNPIVSDLQDEGKASANLLINGAFNVNSTSVPAWTALLTSLNGQSFNIYNYLSGQIENRYVTNPILRYMDVGRFNANDPWDGMRSLTDVQVTALAKEIVNQVRARGPFLSMGDFLNRRLSTVGSTYTTNNLMGALQAAIENTQTNGSSSDVNGNIHGNASVCGPVANYTFALPSPNFTVPTTGYNQQIPVNKIVTNSAVGIPGYLMQQDLVQAFAPVMTVRSDTFVIRVYGESDRKNSKPGNPIPEAQAWGEAVVQRLPDYFDQTDPALTKPSVKGLSTPLGDATPVFGPSGPIVNAANQTFGRRFKVVSFRWLNQNEL